MHTVPFLRDEGNFKQYLTEYKTDEIIFWEGEIAQFFYVILSGKVEIRRVNKEGNQLTLAVLERGQFFGEMALLNNLPRTASAIARSRTKLLVLTADHLMSVLHEDSHFAMKMIRMLCDRLKNLDDILVKV